MVKIQLVIEEDLQTILKLQKLAFKSEVELYDSQHLQPMTQTIEEIRKEFKHLIFLKAEKDGQIIGAVRAFRKNGTCHISKLVVHPDHQNEGIGTKLMKQVEEIFENTERFELFTGHKSKKNIHLYHKLGYTIFKSHTVNDVLTFVYMEKKNT